MSFTGTDTSLNFGSGSLAIADGVSFTLGDPGNRLDHLRLGYNLSGIDLADAVINLTRNQFAAYVGDELSVGRVANVGWQSRAMAAWCWARPARSMSGPWPSRPRSTSAGPNRPSAPASPAMPTPVPPSARSMPPKVPHRPARRLNVGLTAGRAPPTAP
ncbi:MAG: hypothetical protein IPK39_14765 [Sulfuritalea sp.]|nr:hypothetical protein [Sulfuritalea sp.]